MHPTARPAVSDRPAPVLLLRASLRFDQIAIVPQMELLNLDCEQ